MLQQRAALSFARDLVASNIDIATCFAAGGCFRLGQGDRVAGGGRASSVQAYTAGGGAGRLHPTRDNCAWHSVHQSRVAHGAGAALQPHERLGRGAGRHQRRRAVRCLLLPARGRQRTVSQPGWLAFSTRAQRQRRGGRRSPDARRGVRRREWRRLARPAAHHVSQGHALPAERRQGAVRRRHGRGRVGGPDFRHDAGAGRRGSRRRPRSVRGQLRRVGAAARWRVVCCPAGGRQVSRDRTTRQPSENCRWQADRVWRAGRLLPQRREGRISKSAVGHRAVRPCRWPAVHRAARLRLVRADARHQRRRLCGYLRLQRFPDAGSVLAQRRRRAVSRGRPGGGALGGLRLDGGGLRRHRP